MLQSVLCPVPGQGEEVWISLWEPCKAADGSSPHARRVRTSTTVLEQKGQGWVPVPGATTQKLSGTVALTCSLLPCPRPCSSCAQGLLQPCWGLRATSECSVH